MKRNVNDVANVLISAAIIKSIEIRKLDPISVKRIVMGVCIGPAEVSMILTAGLVYATTYVASYEYESTSASKIKKVVLRKFYEAVGVSGNVRFDGRFIDVWNAIIHDLNNQDEIRRIGYTLQNDSSVLVHAVVRSCLEWSLRTIGGSGYMPEYVRDGSGIYDKIMNEFWKFAIMASRDINFDDCDIVGGFKSINLNNLPVSNSKYDVFISYRKCDGDVYARLLNQELSYQGLKCFFDVESVSNGEYNLQILSALKSASNFLFVKSEKSMIGLEDPDDHVRIELEAGRHFQKNVVIVAPSGVTRDMSRVSLPFELEYLKNLRVYRLDVGETYRFCVDKILLCGIKKEYSV